MTDPGSAPDPAPFGAGVDGPPPGGRTRRTSRRRSSSDRSSSDPSTAGRTSDRRAAEGRGADPGTESGDGRADERPPRRARNDEPAARRANSDGRSTERSTERSDDRASGRTTTRRRSRRRREREADDELDRETERTPDRDVDGDEAEPPARRRRTEPSTRTSSRTSSGTRASSGPRRRRSRATTDADDDPWTPTDRMRQASTVQVFGSSRCDERGALVVDVALPPRGHLDPNALRVVQRLVRGGFEAYLVGGCVRDLLIGRRPKDFDVATEAHPREVKRLFRNGRIIGRRFKLVHVVYGPEVVETATFRAAPRSSGTDDDPTVDDLMIVDDNEFGTAAEDAQRRDFTINGLFLDPIEGEIIDYVDGLEDVEARVIRTIGDPRVRIAEDPVRILRAIKFASRLGFSIHPDTWDAMVEHADGLAQAAAPRVVEEILRLLQSGHAHDAFRLLDEVGALPVLLPALSRWRNACGASDDPDDDGWRVLTALDERVARGEAPTTSFCLAALFAPAYLDAWEEHSADHEHHMDTEALHLAARLLSPLSAVARLSRRDVGQAKRLLANQPRFSEKASRRFKPVLFAHAPEFDESLDLLALRIQARCEERDLLDLWLERREEAREMPSEIIDRERKTRRKRRRRRRKPRSN